MNHKYHNIIYAINRDNLNVGIEFWLEKKPRWGTDFHNGFYKHLAELQTNGFTEEWWEGMVDVLWEWSAIRPLTKQYIRERGRIRLKDLADGHTHLIRECQMQNPINMLVDWEDAEPLFQAAKSIKNVTSPVFPSKLCHFIMPGVFPVIDQEVLGGSQNYPDYWRLCKRLWLEADDTDPLIKILSDRIGDIIAPGYPWTTKIAELCLIGKRAKFK